MVRIEVISPKNVESIFGQIYQWVIESLGVDKSYTPEDIESGCKQGRWVLRLVYLDDVLTGFFISALIPAPQGKICYGAWLGGRDLECWVKDGLKEIEVWAISVGCIAYTFIGRKAWKRLLGYDYEGVYYYKKL